MYGGEKKAMIMGKDFEKFGLIKPVKASKIVSAFPKRMQAPRRGR